MPGEDVGLPQEHTRFFTRISGTPIPLAVMSVSGGTLFTRGEAEYSSHSLTRRLHPAKSACAPPASEARIQYVRGDEALEQRSMPVHSWVLIGMRDPGSQAR